MEINGVIMKLIKVSEANGERNADDYIGDDGLLYCGNCRTKKQCLTPKILNIEPRVVNCPCKCQREREEAEKERNEFIQRVQRNTANARIPVHYSQTSVDMLDDENRKFAIRYLANFYENKGDTIGLLLYGDVGTGKSFLASCLANEMLSKGLFTAMRSMGGMLMRSLFPMF